MYLTSPFLWDFLSRNDLTICICHRDFCNDYYAEIIDIAIGSDHNSASIKDHMTYHGVYGEGHSPELAVDNLVSKCSGCLLSFINYSKKGKLKPREVQFPIINSPVTVKDPNLFSNYEYKSMTSGSIAPLSKVTAKVNIGSFTIDIRDKTFTQEQINNMRDLLGWEVENIE